MKLRINISIFLALMLISGGLGMGVENKALENETLEIEELNNFPGGSSSSSKRKTVTEEVYIVERVLAELRFGLYDTAGYSGGYLAGNKYDWYIVEDVKTDNENVVRVRNRTYEIFLEGISEGNATVTAKVYNKNNTNNIVIAKIPVTVTDSVYNE